MEKVIFSLIILFLAFSLFSQNFHPPDDVLISIDDELLNATVVWDSVYSATSYKVYSSDSPYTGYGEDFSGIFSGTCWSTPIYGTERFYFVTAINERSESDPSETVGFYHFDCPVGYTFFSHPFTYYDSTHTPTLDANDIIGDKLSSGTPATADRIIDAKTGEWIFYLPPWIPPITFDMNHAYCVKIYSIPNDLYLCGSVEQDVIDYGTMNLGYNVIGLKEAGAVPLDDLDLLSSGFTGGVNPVFSDQIQEVGGGGVAWYNSNTSSWINVNSSSVKDVPLASRLPLIFVYWATP